MNSLSRERLQEALLEIADAFKTMAHEGTVEHHEILGAVGAIERCVKQLNLDVTIFD